MEGGSWQRRGQHSPVGLCNGLLGRQVKKTAVSSGNRILGKPNWAGMCISVAYMLVLASPWCLGL